MSVEHQATASPHPLAEFSLQGYKTSVFTSPCYRQGVDDLERQGLSASLPLSFYPAKTL